MKNIKLPILIIICVLTWIALVTQLYLNIQINKMGGKVSLTETLIRFFSYFTILSNFLVALATSFNLKDRSDNRASFFRKPQTLTAINLYILIVGLVYNIILRYTWNPQGIQKLVDEALHTLIPILFLIYWWIFVPKSNLKFRNILNWMIFPTLYLAFVLLRGSFSNFYPYPFIDVTALGYPVVFRNAGFLVMVFFFMALTLVYVPKGIDKVKK